MQKAKRILGYLCVVMCIISLIIAISIIISSHEDIDVATALTMVAVICGLYAYYLLKKTPTEISILRIFIGVNCIGVCILGAYEIFTSSQGEKMQNFAVTFFCAFLAFFLLKNNKSNKQKELKNINIAQAPSSLNNQDFVSKTEPGYKTNNNPQSQPTLPDGFTHANNIPNRISTKYSEMETQNDLRILNDCINLMQTTNNFDTFFSRYELAMKKSSTLESAGLNINPDITSQALMQLKNSNLERILQTAYEKELSSINGLKTTKGKINRINKFLETLSKYKEYLISVNSYKKIALNLHTQKRELETEQHTAISEEYQAAHQKSIADAERIKKMYEALETERYQIIGEPDCKHYKICRQNNGKVYYLSEYKTGQTAPPFHERCTCTVVPYFDDEF